MKILLALGCLLLLQPLCSRAQQVPTVSDVDTLAPGDLGISKWVFKATVAAGQVVVVREEKSLDGKPLPGKESITRPLEEKFERALLFINRSFFSDPDEESKSEKVYQIAGIFKERIERASIKNIGGKGGPGTLQLEFETPRGLLTYTFSVQVEEYDVVKKRQPDLPEIRPRFGWTAVANREQ